MEKATIKKIALLGILTAAAYGAYSGGLLEKLNLEYLKTSQAAFTASYEANPTTFISTFIGIYVVVTALSLPGAAVMTLAAGGIFGFWLGTLIVSFASTVGATLACMGSRYLLRDWVQEKFKHQIDPINRGISEEGAFYLFTLRLIPAFPFFLINLAMGLTPMPFSTFFWVSQVGMLGGTMVYVNAGKELSRIDSLTGILSPGLLASFFLLGIFPLLAKKAVAKFRARNPHGDH